MVVIRKEIHAIEHGTLESLDNPFMRMPHIADLLIGEWARSYAKYRMFYPRPTVRTHKYWPPVGRVDN
jgi:glycine dehydrogenase